MSYTQTASIDMDDVDCIGRGGRYGGCGEWMCGRCSLTPL